MGSDQISEKPLPPEPKRCSQCGQLAAPNAEMCWLCLEKFSVQEGVALTRSPARETPRPDNIAWMIFSLIAVVLAIAIALETPAILALLLALAVPALIRTVHSSAMRPPNEQPSLATVGAIFLSSLGISIFTGVATLATFFVICFGVGFGVFAVTESLVAVLIGVVAGAIAGIWVAVVLYRSIWR